MDIKAEFEKFLKRFTDINDKPVMWFVGLTGFFAGGLLSHLLPAIILLSAILLILGGLMLIFNKQKDTL